MKERGQGLLLWGGVGTGKTFAAACIAHALTEQAVPVLMTNFSKILNLKRMVKCLGLRREAFFFTLFILYILFFCHFYGLCQHLDFVQESPVSPNSCIEELERQRQAQAKLVADLTANFVSPLRLKALAAICGTGSLLTSTISAGCLTCLFHKCGPQVNKS